MDVDPVEEAGALTDETVFSPAPGDLVDLVIEHGDVRLLADLMKSVGSHAVHSFLHKSGRTAFKMAAEGVLGDGMLTVMPAMSVFGKAGISLLLDHAKVYVMAFETVLADPSAFRSDVHVPGRIRKFVEEMDARHKLRIISLEADDTIYVAGLAFHMGSTQGFPLKGEISGTDPWETYTAFMKRGGVIYLFSIPTALRANVARLAGLISEKIGGGGNDNGEEGDGELHPLPAAA
jgi:hypothetical protein